MTIFFLVKFFAEEKWADDFVRGQIYANSLSYFKEIEKRDAKRGDRHEGVIWWIQPDQIQLTLNDRTIPSADFAGPLEMQSTWLSNQHVFCMYAAHSGDIDLRAVTSEEEMSPLRKRVLVPDECLNFGDFAVVVTAGPEFVRRVEVAATARGYRGRRGLVHYYDPDEFHGYFSESEAAFRKHRRYAYQQEYRFLFETLVAGNEPLILDVGDLRDVTIRMDSAEINKRLDLRLSANSAPRYP